ncbi:nucleotidyltransferase family protein [Ideonella oryzae]|uniref:Nucleotidyltransferase family protein n=1 Tax=Ideonella oryzae TaxID=2937441 RepID=A0ABT1BQ11_9BURK|nr:nucleotidyltransferase family protein [Ideonella oryzae]MCO5977662.1 nucleotidyltransferase family protein [Ideonella oryzae]
MPSSQNALTDRLVELVRQSAWFMEALVAVRALGLPSWCIGAGAVRNLVWDALHQHAAPSALSDIDVAYFDEADLTPARDAALQRSLSLSHPDLPWEVTNQAGVHLWFEQHFGHPVAPLRSLEEAVGTWPEYATSVGLTLRPDGTLQVIAPHGLQDLFDIVVRRNPTRVNVTTYRQRTASKRYAERWSKVRIIPC